LGAPLSAQTSVEDLIHTLGQQGYNKVKISRTLLGRHRLLATDGAKAREVILTRDGEILRDASYPLASSKREAAMIGEGSGTDNAGDSGITTASSGTNNNETTAVGDGVEISALGVGEGDIGGPVSVGENGINDAPSVEGSISVGDEGTSGVSK